MKAFSYVAYTSNGRRRSGTVVADSEAEASRQLSARALYVAELTPPAKPRGTAEPARLWQRQRWSRHGRLSPDLQMVFTRQMAVLLAAELPVEAALEAMGDGGHPALDAVAARARAALLEGASLSEALGRTGAGFAPYYLAALQAGESAGQLSAVVAELADHLEQSGTDKAQIATALIYPGFVAAVSVLVCAILMVSVAPEIAAMFTLSGRPLPVLTEWMLWLTQGIRAHATLLVSLGAGSVAALVLIFNLPRGRAFADRVFLRLPLVGRLMRLAAAVQYMRTLALVLSARHTVLNAAGSAALVLRIARFRQEGEAVTRAVSQGESLSSALTQLSFLPPVARQLIAAGEASARLARMSTRAASLVEHRLSTERKRIATLLEPALMIVVGAGVLVIVLSVLLPIFDLQAVVAG